MNPLTRDRREDQRLAALERANEIRCARAALKRLVRAGELDVWAVIDEPHPDYHGQRIYDLLCAVPKLGRVKVSRLLSRLGVPHSKTLVGLSPRQRGELVTALRAHAGAGAPR